MSTASSRSVRGVFRNLSRAGVAKNRSRTSTRVPGAAAAGCGALLRRPRRVISQALPAPAGRETMRMRLTAPIDGNASPRNPKAEIRSRSSSGNFEVQWRSTANDNSSALMPTPSSATAIKRLAAVAQAHLDPRGAGVDRVFDQFLDRRRRALDDLAGGDAVDQDRRQQTDRHRRNLADRRPAED